LIRQLNGNDSGPQRRVESGSRCRHGKGECSGCHDRQAGTFWGGYSGYFKDPDGHLWEIVWNPQFTS